MSTKLTYVGDENAYSRYTLSIEGRRVFDVLVDNATPAQDVPAELSNPPVGHSLHTIYIAMVDAPIITRQATKGFAVRAPHGDVETGMGYRVQPNSIRTYLRGREATLLARLFVPAA